MTDGIASMKIVDGSRVEYRKMPRIRTTLVVKLKAGPKFKARLRLRGDRESLSALSYSSSPTVGRDMLKVAIITYVNYPSYVCATVDISQAFIQADVMDARDWELAYPTECAVLENDGWFGG